MNYPLTLTKQIPDAQIIDLCDLLDGRTSPWLVATETDLEQAQVTIAHEPQPANATVTTALTFTSILAALAALHDEGELCCAAVMVDDHLGAGCAIDADLVVQRALFGASVIGNQEEK